MDIQSHTDGECVVLSLAGRLDAATAPTAEAAIDRAIGEGAGHLVFDLSGLAYISSAGLRVLLAAAKKMSRKDGRVVLCALEKSVHEVFEISGLLSIFPIAETVAAAQSLARRCDA